MTAAQSPWSVRVEAGDGVEVGPLRPGTSVDRCYVLVPTSPALALGVARAMAATAAADTYGGTVVNVIDRGVGRFDVRISRHRA